MTKEVKMGKDSQIRLVKIDEDGYVKDRVWVDITETNPIVIDQPTKKQMNGNTKSPVEVIFKDD